MPSFKHEDFMFLVGVSDLVGFDWIRGWWLGLGVGPQGGAIGEVIVPEGFGIVILEGDGVGAEEWGRLPRRE